MHLQLLAKSTALCWRHLSGHHPNSPPLLQAGLSPGGCSEQWDQQQHDLRLHHALGRAPLGEQEVSGSTAQPGHLAKHRALTEHMATPQGFCLCCLNWSTSETRCETTAKTNPFCFQIRPLLQLLGFQKWQNPQG